MALHDCDIKQQQINAFQSFWRRGTLTLTITNVMEPQLQKNS